MKQLGARHFLMSLRLRAACSVFALMITLPCAASDHSLFALSYPAEDVAPHHALDARINFSLDLQNLRELGSDDQMAIVLPDQSVARARVSRVNQEIGGSGDRHTVLALEEGHGSIEIRYTDGQAQSAYITDLRGVVRVYSVRLDSEGKGELVRENAHKYYCINMPAASQLAANMTPVALSQTPTLQQLQQLQSKPDANKVLFLNYWGGTLSDTRWNDQYNEGDDIDYTAYNIDDDANAFSGDERERMWLGWREAAEDYAPFDVNVTTDIALYSAASSEDRSMIIATTTDSWFGSTAGGVANIGSFGSDYSGVGWAWNRGYDALGQTMAHEAGHQMGLHHDGQLHDGQLPSMEYYTGHGIDQEWGPLMGAPYGKTYVQWSRGEYDRADNPEDDLTIIGSVLGVEDDRIGDTSGEAFELSASAYIEERIEPSGVQGGMDTDVYRFQLGSAQNVQIEIKPSRVDPSIPYGSNLSLDAQLLGSDGITVLAQSSQLSPYHPWDNALLFDDMLNPGSYYLVVTALSPNLSWTNGFGEYGNGGFYTVSLSSGMFEPDLVSRITLEDHDVYVGQLLRMSAEVRNIGADLAPQGKVRFLESLDALPSANDVLISERDHNALSPLQADYISEQIVVPGTPGTRYYMACAEGVTGESVVSNNCSAAKAISVSGLSLDLEIADALEQAELSWFRGGDASFFRQTEISMNDGDAAKSGAIDNDEISYLQTQLSGPGWLRFHWKVSSEDEFDYFRLIDNSVEQAAISGEVDWTMVTYEIGAGPHVLQWKYDKDRFTIEGEDAAWLDKVEYHDRKFSFATADIALPEGDSGSTAYTFSVQSEGDSSASASVGYRVVGSGAEPAKADDFGGALPEGSIVFTAGQMLADITLYVTGDRLLEEDEQFELILLEPEGGMLDEQHSVFGTILNDEADRDGDGVGDIIDNCPDDYNPDQRNTDLNILPGGDLRGDACDTDDDADGIADVQDNCPLMANPDQDEVCGLCIPVKVSPERFAIICL